MSNILMLLSQDFRKFKNWNLYICTWFWYLFEML